MPREKPLEPGTELSGKYAYRVRRLVGGGGMAWVYQIEREDPGGVSLWALKELRPQTEDPDTQAHARQLFEQVIELEPDSPLGYAGAAGVLSFEVWRGGQSVFYS